MSQPNLTAKNRILGLPRELRDEIYHFALVDEDHIVFSGHLLDSKLDQETRIMREPRASGTPILYTTTLRQGIRSFGLLRTCRQVNAEIGSMLYRQNQFCIPDLSASYHIPDEHDENGGESQQVDRHELYRRDLSRCLLHKFGAHYSYVQRVTLVLEKFYFFGKYLDGAYTFLWHDSDSPKNRGDVEQICSTAMSALPRIKILTIAWQVADVCLVCHQWGDLFRLVDKANPHATDRQTKDAEDAHVNRICAEMLESQAKQSVPITIPSIIQFQFLMLHKGLNPKGCSCSMCGENCEPLDPDILNKIVCKLRQISLGTVGQNL